MKVYRQTDPSILTEAAAGRCLAVGNFDGVHLGHRALIRSCLDSARAEGLPALLLTFDPHPRTVVEPRRALPLLTPLADKLELLAACGVPECLVYPFTRETADEDGREFIRRYLVGKLGMRRMVVGFNFALGRGGHCRASDLEELGRELGFSVSVTPGIRQNGHLVSSTNIRLLIATGNVEAAAQFLGRPHSLRGPVIAGARLGRLLGFPTANLAPGPERLLPGSGVYIGEVRWRESLHPAVVNVGKRPTLDDSAVLPLVEAHLLDFQENIYDETLEIFFLKRLRDEIRFANFEALGETIGRDVETARQFFRRRALGTIS